MSLETKIQTFEIKAEAFAAMCESKMIAACKEAIAITNKIMASPEEAVAETIIDANVPYAAQAIASVKEALPAIKLIAGIGDTSSTEGLLQRLGSSLTSIIHGGKHPFSWYVSAFDFVCFGAGSAPVATT